MIFGKPFFRITGCFGAILCAVSGCRSENPAEFIRPPSVTETQRMEAERLSKLWSADKECGMLLRERTRIAYAEAPDALSERLRNFGVKCVYLTLENRGALSGKGFSEILRTVTALGDAGLRCNLVLYPHEILPERAHAAPLRWFSKDDPFSDLLDLAVRINSRLPEKHPVCGITVWSGVHRLNLSHPRLPAGLLYRWDESDYGIGSDNDLLMQDFFRHLPDWKQKAAEHHLEFTVAVPSFYIERAGSGDLSVGNMSDFLKTADKVLVLGYGAKPSIYLQSLRKAFPGGHETGRIQGRILCGMVLADHVSDNRESIRRRDWNDFVRILQAMHADLAQKPDFGGMVLMPFDGIELLLER